MDLIYLLIKDGYGLKEHRYIGVNVVTYNNSSEEFEKSHHLGLVYKVNINKNNDIKSVADGEDSLGARWLENNQ